MKARLFAPLLAAVLGCGAAQASDYPSQPINVIVPFAPGGLTDTVARMVGKSLGTRLSVPVIVQNKPGAGGTIGTAFVAKAKPDGYTVLVASGGGHATAPVLYPDLSYDVIKSFEPVAVLGRSSFVLTVNKNVMPVKDLQEFLALVRANPGKYTYSHSGKGSAQNAVGALFSEAAGLDVVGVPYRGSGLALGAIVSGEVGFGFDGTAAVQGMDQLLPLVQFGETRDNPLWPAVPTMIEAGLPEFGSAYTWQGVFVPKGTPPKVVERLAQAIADSLNDAGLREKLLGHSVVPTPELTPQKTAELLASEVARYRSIAGAFKTD